MKLKEIRSHYPQSIFRNKAYELKTQENFVKISVDALNILAEMSFNPLETKILFTLIKHLEMEDGIGNAIAEITTGKGRKQKTKSIYRQQLYEMVKSEKLKEDTFDKHVNNLEKKQLICRIEDEDGKTMYFVNPFAFMVGTKTDARAFALFYKSMFNIYQQ